MARRHELLRKAGDAALLEQLQAIYGEQAELLARQAVAEVAEAAAREARARHDALRDVSLARSRARTLAERRPEVRVLDPWLLDGVSDPAVLREGAALFGRLTAATTG